MARRLFEVTDQWQQLSNRSFIADIIKAPSGDAQSLLFFNSVEDETTSKKFNKYDKGTQVIQPNLQITYVKAERIGFTLSIDE